MMNDFEEKQNYIESLSKTMTNESKIDPMDRVYRVPVADIEYDNYLPTKWGVEYVQLNDEADELEAMILSGKNYLIEGDKGLGKTQLVHNICLKHNIPIVPMNCSDGTKIGDLVGRPQINQFGSYFQLGSLPTAIEVANHFKKCVLYMDEFNAMPHALQLATNSITDDRKSIVANGKVYRLNEGCILAVIATMNPSTYAGVNTLAEASRSRFYGAIWEYPTSDNIKKIIDWTGIPQTEVLEPLLTLTQNVHSLRLNSDVDYSISPRDLAQFTECFRMWSNHELKKPLERSLKNAILSKFSDPAQRELIRKQIKEIFGVDLK